MSSKTILSLIVAVTILYGASTSAATDRRDTYVTHTNNNNRLPKVHSFELISTVSNRKIGHVSNGVTIDICNFTSIGIDSPTKLNFVAKTTDTESVQFYWNSNLSRLENMAEYAFCSDNNGDYNDCTDLNYGKHCITATPFAQDHAQGRMGTNVTVCFQIIRCPIPVQPPLRAPIATPRCSPQRVIRPQPAPIQPRIPVAVPATSPIRVPLLTPFYFIQPTQVVGPVPGNLRSPISIPTSRPVGVPTRVPTVGPTLAPISAPTVAPFFRPTLTPIAKPTRVPTDVPSQNPVSAPTKFPTAGPTLAPSSQPVHSPTSSPTSIPINAPSRTPTGIPTGIPTENPIKTLSITTVAPASSPIMSLLPPTIPTPTCHKTCSLANTCKIPKMSSRWEQYPSLPYNVSESQGGLLGNDFVIFSGFVGTKWTAIRKVFALDTSDINSSWKEMDDIPVVEGLTHTGHVVVNCTKFYMCGGYVGSYTPHPNPTDVCYLYEHTKPRSMQWSQLPSLPDKRAGGGMVYDESQNSLIFAGGASYMTGNDKSTIRDNMNTWELKLDNLESGWVVKSSIPYGANHIGFASVGYQCKQQHYFLGGQKGDDEKNGNVADVYEYLSSSDTWEARPKMLFPRSHFSSSTVADSKGCGLFKMGGAINGGNKTSEVHYYSINNRSWSMIGKLKAALNTPVCVITPSNYLYCQGGNVNFQHSWRVQLL